MIRRHAEILKTYAEGALREQAGANGRGTHPSPGAPASDAGPAITPLIVRRASTVVARHAEYLWRPWLPRSCYVDLGGDPGSGKTFMAVELIACATRGEWPGREHTEATSVTIIAAEDALETVLIPRLTQAKAHLDRITVIEGARHPDGGGLDDVLLDRDFDGILAHIRETGAGLVYVDALVDVLASHDGKGYVESRQATRAVSRLARDSEATILATRHMKKARDGIAWHQSVGSVAYASRARVMLQIYQDNQDEERRILACAKHNMAKIPASIAFRLEGGEEDIPPHVGWLGEDQRTANQLAGEAAAGRDSSVKDRAQAWLEQRLAAGPIEPRTIIAEGEAAGFARATLHRAADTLGVQKLTQRPSGFAQGKRSTWALPVTRPHLSLHTSHGDRAPSETYDNHNNLGHMAPISLNQQEVETHGGQDEPEPPLFDDDEPGKEAT